MYRRSAPSMRGRGFMPPRPGGGKFVSPLARPAARSLTAGTPPGAATALAGTSCSSSGSTSSTPAAAAGASATPSHPAATAAARTDTPTGPAKRMRFSVPLKPVNTSTVGTGSSSSSNSSKPAKAGFAAPTQTPAAAAGSGSSEEREERYFQVMWCKQSNKKHKKWEADAVLLVRGKRTVVLVNMEGKEIAKGSMTPSELTVLKEGQTLYFSRREVEILAPIKSEDWETGRCFHQGAAINASASVYKMAKPKANSFKPTVATGANAPEPIKREPKGPRYDPNAPNALVMPAPPASHQRLFNTKKHDVVPVVVDPFLSSHLRPHQRAGVTFLYECVSGIRLHAENPGHCGAILADSMGLGKTLQCITLIWTLLKQGPYGGDPLVHMAVIVCPGSLVKNWKREFKKWLGNERLPVFAVDAENTVAAFAASRLNKIMVISYEMFLRNAKALHQIPFDLVICDEAHRLKNTTTKTATAVAGLRTRRRVALTGTPIQNDLQEFFAIVNFCNSGILESATLFHNIYEKFIVAARQPGATAKEKRIGLKRAAMLNQRLSAFFLRRTAEVNTKYLPPKNDIVVFCPPTPLQRALYRRLVKNRAFRTCLEGRGSGTGHLRCISALRKVCNSPKMVLEDVLKLGESARAEDDPTNPVTPELRELFPEDFALETSQHQHSGKLMVLRQLLEALFERHPDERILLVSISTQCLDELALLCDDMAVGYVRLDGSVPTTKRMGIVEHFNKRHGNERVFLLSSKAGGTGLNIVGASRLVLFDPDWNPANDLQAMARIWRDGQKRNVHIYRFLTTGTMEEKVYQRQVTKQGLSVAMDGNSKTTGASQFSRDELRDLFTLREDTLCDTHDLLPCNCLDAHVGKEQAAAVASAAWAAGADAKDKNSKIFELMSWAHHLPGSLDNPVPDDVMQAIDETLVSFFFYHSDAARRAAEQAAEEQAAATAAGETGEQAAEAAGAGAAAPPPALMAQESAFVPDFEIGDDVLAEADDGDGDGDGDLFDML